MILHKAVLYCISNIAFYFNIVQSF